MKRKYLIVTHKTLAAGFEDTLNFFTNNRENIIAISSYENGENSFPKDKVESVIKNIPNNSQLFIFTDLLGGSVNQKCSQYVYNENVIVITGINLALVLSLVLEPEGNIPLMKIQKIINDAKKQMVLMNTYLNNNTESDE
ncbi:PTS sugar transporter subunit IIA [Liquorilactobacillus ghanensis]|nr:hypothetical protein [Liquorilactobacillus ghanensis]